MNRPFDGARYEALLEGLDVTVLKLSEVQADNEKLRIDDGFFSKLAVFTQRRIEQLPHVRFGEVASVFRKGIFDIKASSYASTGIPFVRIGDLKQGLIEKSGLAYIPEDVHLAERKTALRFGDIILSKTAYSAASFVNLPECNVSQDTIAVSLTPQWRKKLRSGFIAAFFNTRHGLALMKRQFQGNVQAHLSLPDGKKLPIPLFSESLQKQVHALYEIADKRFDEAAERMNQAEQTLLRALGLEGWQPPEPLTYTRRASEAFAAGRLDADYFAPRVAELMRHFGENQVAVRDVAPPRHEQFIPRKTGEFNYIEISGVRSDGTVTSERVLQSEAPSRATWHVRAGDVITSTVRPIRRLSAIITPEQDGFVCSSGFVVLEPRVVAPELLLTYLRLPPVCELMDLHTSASLYPAISERDLLSLPFPTVAKQSETDIAASVQSAHAARREARALLERAKRAVEVAIEGSEEAALALLDTTEEF